jgi:tetratricopeptide (TPR) repeat protein
MLRRVCVTIFFACLINPHSWAQSPADTALLSALNAHKYAEAEDRADSSLKNRPKDPWLWTVRGMAMEGLGKTQASLESIDKALSLDPQYIPALKAAAQITYQHRDARATKYLERLLTLRPDEATAHAMAGVLDYEAHNCTGAIPHFEQSAQLVQSNETSATEFAACLLNEHRTADAVRVLTQARTLHPASRNLRYDLGLAQLEDGHSEEALVTLQPASDDDAGILNLRASVESAAGNLDAAYADLKRAAELNPLEERNYLDLALLCLDHNHEQLAVDVTAVGIAHLPKDAELYAVRGIAYAQLGKYDAAQQDFARATELDPGRPLGEVARSMLYVEMDQPEKAKQSLREQVEKAPGDPVANTLLANLLIHQGAAPGTPELAEAKAALTRALQTDPNAVDALILLGKIDLEQEDLQGALNAMERAEQLDPDNRTTLNQTLLILRKLGRIQDATRVAERLTALLSQDAQRRNKQPLRTGPER